jgi:hypothetical protein
MPEDTDVNTATFVNNHLQIADHVVTQWQNFFNAALDHGGSVKIACPQSQRLSLSSVRGER